MVVSNSLGAVTSSPPATLTLVSPVATPTPQVLFSGLTAHFNVSVSGLSATYKWQENGVDLSDGGRISGSATTNLQISSLQTTDSASYAMVLTSGSLVVTSTPSALTVLPPSSASLYDQAVLAAGPVAYYRFNENGNPATSNLMALDNAAAFNGVYGPDVTNGFSGVAGPRPSDGYPGFAANNAAALFSPNDTNSQITIAPWNLHTDTATFAFWVNPADIQGVLTAILWSGTNDNTYAGVNYYRTVTSGAGLARQRGPGLHLVRRRLSRLLCLGFGNHAAGCPVVAGGTGDRSLQHDALCLQCRRDRNLAQWNLSRRPIYCRRQRPFPLHESGDGL